mmetsp:Transcript_54339/g.90163  ORF Transcript_54339/g.90163 Transcript_54339/m.90163 type:complete len:121 (-) Transcript_54339:81-443(-)
MQAAIAQVELHCSAELEAYAQCVDNNSNSWLLSCADHKHSLNACAAKHSGMVESVKRRCKAQIEQYERCLKGNPSSPGTCDMQLLKLYQCSEDLPPLSAPASSHLPACDCASCGERPPPL